MLKILFLCTGNTCRSPMAEYLFKRLVLKNHLDIYVDSRGLHTYGDKISNNAAIVLKNVYNIIDTGGHVSKQLTIADLEDFDLILTMTNSHKLAIDKSFYNKVFTISEYASKAITDISDPYGQDLQVYEKCLKEIEHYLNLIAYKFIKISP